MDKIEINRALNDFHVVPDRSRPLDYEVFAINKVFGQQAETSNEVVFNPLYQTRHCDNGNFGRYFSITRKARTGDSNKENMTPARLTPVPRSLSRWSINKRLLMAIACATSLLKLR